MTRDDEWAAPAWPVSGDDVGLRDRCERAKAETRDITAELLLTLAASVRLRESCRRVRDE